MTKALDVKRPAFLILGAPGSGKGTEIVSKVVSLPVYLDTAEPIV
jgi:hypothetical protein